MNPVLSMTTTIFFSLFYKYIVQTLLTYSIIRKPSLSYKVKYTELMHIVFIEKVSKNQVDLEEFQMLKTTTFLL